MEKIKRLSKMPYAQARVIIRDDGSIALKSYNTVVATIIDDMLQIGGLYSMTTKKHLMAFVREYVSETLDFSFIKSLYVNREVYNLKTGEVF